VGADARARFTEEAPVSEDVTVQQPTTGHPVVDQVLSSLTDLDARPAGEHVAVFEAAHDRLREALSDAGDESPARVGPSGDLPPGA
jgi:hypothetical protein